MWSFQSIFDSNATVGNYPESLIKASIERAVDCTDPWIRAVSGYKKKLRPAVVRAIDHVMALVDGMAPPIAVGPDINDIDPRLRAFFISTADIRKILASDRSLAEFKYLQSATLPRTFALLAMEKQEKIILGAELSSNIVLRDVPQIVVSFDSHRFFDPAASEDETRRQLKRRAYDHLLSLALRRITNVKTERDKLERYRTLLQSKLNHFQRWGWGFRETATDEHLDIIGIEELLDRIETQLLELGGDDRMLEVYLGIVIGVLGRPEEHLWTREETLNVDRMGIKRSKAVSDTQKVTLNMMSDDEGHSLVVSLVSISGEAIQNNSAE